MEGGPGRVSLPGKMLHQGPVGQLAPRIAFQRLLVRLPKLALVPGPLDWSDNLVVRGLHRLEIAIGTAARDRAHA